MKVVLSRKGIDGGNGGTASPIIVNSRGVRVPVSIPIGGGSEERRYSEIRVQDYSLLTLAQSLGVRDKYWNQISDKTSVHFDPDLDEKSMKRIPGWKPTFGQCSAALGHLLKKNVDKGDLFLFLGWFRHAEANANGVCYKDDNAGVHSFFGWLQVEDVWEMSCKQTEDLKRKYPEWAWKHPHFKGEDGNGYGNIYVASNQLVINGKPTKFPGAGVFRRFSENAQLTCPGQKRSVWKLPGFFHKKGYPRLSYHLKEDRWTKSDDDWQLQSVARGQEFILDFENLDSADRETACEWIVNLIQKHA